MKITLVSGSLRHTENSQSLKIAKYMETRLHALDITNDTFLFDLGLKPYPLWDESIWEGDEKWQETLKPISAELESSDAFIFLVPEYHGMAPSGLKNFLLMHNKHQIGHKPALLVGVSSSDGGAYAIAEMRMNSSKNNRLCYIPEQLIVRNAENVLNSDASKNDKDADSYFRERIDYTLEILEQYALALSKVRESGKTHDDRFSNGM